MSTDWSRSASALLFTCQLIYNESSKTLYEQADFHFHSHSSHEGMDSDSDMVFCQHLAFLRTVPAPSLQFIRSLTIQHDTMLGRIAAKRKRETEEGEMWRTISQAMPNLTSLQIKLWVHEYNDGIVPLFRSSHAPLTAMDLQATPWLQPLLNFRTLTLNPDGQKKKDTKLKHLRFDLLYRHGEHELDMMWMGYRNDRIIETPPGWDQENASLCVMGKWGVCMEKLHHSMGKAIRDVILGESEPWGEHLALLGKYYAWEKDYHRSTGLFSNEMDERLAVHVMIRGPSRCTPRRCVCGFGGREVNADWP